MKQPPPGGDRHAPTARVLAIANQKGGVGKTTTAVNLATAMVACAMKVLVIDLDPQGNASTGLGIERDDRDVDSYAVLIGDATMAEATVDAVVPGLTVLPSSLHLSGAEIELATTSKREYRLRHAVTAFLASAGAGYDYILIDCPPSLGLLNINAFVAANAVMVPLQCAILRLGGPEPVAPDN